MDKSPSIRLAIHSGCKEGCLRTTRRQPDTAMPTGKGKVDPTIPIVGISIIVIGMIIGLIIGI